MYKLIKKNIKSIIPDKFLFKNEVFFRIIYGFFFLGNSHKCNVCNKKLRRFIQLENGDYLCPICGSLSRNRRLWFLLNSENSIKGNFLHFSPSRSIFRNLKKIKSINYFPTKFGNEFLADYKFDITEINQPNGKFHTIVYFHILEHIKDDIKAMKELCRILKPSGTIFVQTPLKEGDIYENNRIVSPEERELHFGQADLVRFYSLRGLKGRLENCGFKVLMRTFQTCIDDLFYGFRAPETILKLSK